MLLHGNLGWSRRVRGGADATVWSLGVETATDPTVAADVFGDDRTRPAASVGFGCGFGGGLSASVAYAVQFDRPRLRTLTFGAKFVLR